MSTYKVIQDIEAEDKLVGPLTLRQFIYAGISAICLYLSFLSVTKHAVFMLVIFVPIAGATGFFAFPWGKDQPTEIWALAKIRFYAKPRKRIWDQSGTKELVTVTAPKVVEHRYTNTIDSRGWAVKNVNVNLSDSSAGQQSYISDRLVNASSLPQEVSTIDVRASDDMLDESASPVAQQFNAMINASATAHRQQIMAQLQQDPALAAPAQPQPTPSRQQQPAAPPADYWFMQPPPTTPGQSQFVDSSVVTPGLPQPPVVPQAAAPTPEEQAMLQHFKEENSRQTIAYEHLKTVKTPQQLAAEAARAQAEAANAKAPVTALDPAAIMNLANNDDLDVATIAREARREVESNDGEVVISLH
jgi:hypothetical protein